MGHDFSRGMHWIGHPGSLVPIIDYGSESPSYDVKVAVSEGMSGAQRVRVPRTRPGRTWDLSIPDAHNDEVAAVETLLVATMPPYQLVTAAAQVSNVLTPERSVMADSNPALALGGWWPVVGRDTGALVRLNPSAAFGNSAPVYIGPAPIPPAWTGRSVTVTVLVATARAAGAQVGLRWLNAAGNAVGSVIWSAAATGMDGLRRVHSTGKPPAGAVSCTVVTYYAEVLAEPQVSWTDHPVEWRPGQGADHVVFTAFGWDTDLAVPEDRNLRRSTFNLALMEPTP